MSLKNFRASGMAIEGMEELVHNLNGVLPKEAANLARATVHSVAGEVRNNMRKKAPKATGNLRKAIVTRRNRATPTQVSSDVIITYGKNAKNDAWYWHLVEWGTTKTPAKPFVTPSVEEMRPKIPGIFRYQWGKKLERLMAKKARR